MQRGGVDPFVDQLARLCRDHRTRAKWIFVPTHSLGRTLGERIALEGTNWLNLRFVTPLDIALAWALRSLLSAALMHLERGWVPR